MFYGFVVNNSKSLAFINSLKKDSCDAGTRKESVTVSSPYFFLFPAFSLLPPLFIADPPIPYKRQTSARLV
jgi:hypothetical protein